MSKIIDQYGNKIVADNSFTAGNKMSRELGKWQPWLKSADAEVLPEKELIEGRSHDLARNNGFAHGVVQSQKDTVVGSSYRLSLRPETRVLKIDAEEANNWASEVEAKFHLWADDPECWVDASRKRTFAQIVRDSVSSDMLSGEFMLSREWRPSPTGFNTCFQVVEPERIRTPSSLTNDERIRAGVRRDKYGSAVSYYVLNKHPREGVFFRLDDGFKKVDKYNAYNWLQFIHIFEAQRGGQTRGYSKFSSIIKKMKMLDRQEDVELEASILAATYAMVVTSDFGANSIMEAMGQASDDNDPFTKLLAKKVGYKRDLNLNWDGTKIPHLFPGEQIEMLNSNHPNNNFDGFQNSMLRHMARGLGTSFEQLSGDFSKTTFSSARASMTEAWKYVQSKRKGIASKVATIMFRLWLDEAISRKIVALPDGVKEYFPNRQALTRCDWIGAGKGSIDEQKSAKANAIKLKSGETTLQQVAAEAGLDWQENIAQSAREFKERVDAFEKVGIEVTDEMKIKMMEL
ncbi:MAG: phage portal protein [Arenicella sp.]